MALVAKSFFEKKANRDQEPQINYWRTALTWESEALTARDTEGVGSG